MDLSIQNFDSQQDVEIEFFKTSDGQVYGWTENGQIYLTEAGLNPDTLIHEYTHLWANAMMRDDPEEWEHIKTMLTGTTKMREILADVNYQDIWRDTDKLCSETLARYSAEMNTPLFYDGLVDAEQLAAVSRGEETSKFKAGQIAKRIIDSLDRFWKWTTERFFEHKYVNLEHVSKCILSDMIGKDKLTRENFMLSKTLRNATNKDLAEKLRYPEKNLMLGKLKDSVKEVLGIDGSDCSVQLTPEVIKFLANKVGDIEKDYSKGFSQSNLDGLWNSITHADNAYVAINGDDKFVYLVADDAPSQSNIIHHETAVKFKVDGDKLLLQDVEFIKKKWHVNWVHAMEKEAGCELVENKDIAKDFVSVDGFNDIQLSFKEIHPNKITPIKGTEIFYTNENPFTFTFPYQKRTKEEVPFTHSKEQTDEHTKRLDDFKLKDLLNRDVDTLQKVARLKYVGEYSEGTYAEKLINNIIDNTEVVFEHLGAKNKDFDYCVRKGRNVLVANVDSLSASGRTEEGMLYSLNSTSAKVEGFIEAVNKMINDRSSEITHYLIGKLVGESKSASRVKVSVAKEEDLARVQSYVDKVRAMNEISPLKDEITPENVKMEKLVKKVISSGQTGVATLGLVVASNLHIPTGGTAAVNFYTEREKPGIRIDGEGKKDDLHDNTVDNFNKESLKAFGLTEISETKQAGFNGQDFYTPLTEQNILDSDGTVFFCNDEDPYGKVLNKDLCTIHQKPFILNPTALELHQWLMKNEIHILNVVGSRGSSMSPEESDNISKTLANALRASLVSFKEKKKTKGVRVCGLYGTTAVVERKKASRDGEVNIYGDEVLGIDALNHFKVSLRDLGYNLDQEFEFDSIAQGLQAFKCNFAELTKSNDELFEKILNTTDRDSLESLGKKVEKFSSLAYNRKLGDLMKVFIKNCAKQIPEFKNKLFFTCRGDLYTAKSSLFDSGGCEFEQQYLSVLKDVKKAGTGQFIKDEIFKKETQKMSRDNKLKI